MRSRVSITRLSGRMTPRVIASRSSATFLPEKSRPRAADAADCPALRAPFSAFCWRARALPPALAARLRAAVLRVDEPDRLVDEERRLVDELEPRALEPRELEPRELEPEPRARSAARAARTPPAGVRGAG